MDPIKQTPPNNETPIDQAQSLNQRSEYVDWRNLPDQYDPSLETPGGIPLDMR